jgi:SAM-dependent methyltransferase
MTARSCPVCAAPPSDSTLFLERNFDPSKVSAFSFASRKVPEFMCHRLIRCTQCDLVYADEPPDQAVLARAYHESAFDSAEEANDAAIAYAKAIETTLARLPRRGSALEIGTGTGVFLDELSRAGFDELIGVEPSTAAIAAAPEHRRHQIREGIFQSENFTPESFDLICCFMTLEHVRDPGDLVAGAKRLLRPGGALVLVTHDYHAWINRMLGSRSPIIDIEHMQLFSKKSLDRLLTGAGFVDINIQTFRNRYALKYWARLLPLPSGLKQTLTGTMERLNLGKVKASINVGNMMTVGFVPRR